MSDYINPAFAVAVAIPFAGGALGGYVTSKNMGWLRKLKKPSWNPPDKVFGPVWSVLYCGMGVSSYMVWKSGGGYDGDAWHTPIAWYGAQLALNWAWSPIMFGLRKPKWAFAEVVCMWGAIAGTIYQFYGINPTASYLMIPYLGWVTFAAALNFRIWRDNPDEAKITEVTDTEVKDSEVSDKKE